MSIAEWEKIKGKRVVAANERAQVTTLMFGDGTKLVISYNNYDEVLVSYIEDAEWQFDSRQ